MSWRGVAAATGAAVMLAASSVGWQHESVRTIRAERGATVELDGAALFRVKGCASCHDGPDSTASSGFPSLADASSWAGTRREALSAADYLAESIREPWAFRSPAFRSLGGPVEAMPALGLDEEEIRAIVQYLLGGCRPRSRAGIGARRAARAAPVVQVAARALVLTDGLCRDWLRRADTGTFTRQAAISAELHEFGVCAGLLAED